MIGLDLKRIWQKNTKGILDSIEEKVKAVVEQWREKLKKIFDKSLEVLSEIFDFFALKAARILPYLLLPKTESKTTGYNSNNLSRRIVLRKQGLLD